MVTLCKRRAIGCGGCDRLLAQKPAPPSPPSMFGDPRPLIAHVVFRFDVGGLENGVVNLINHMPAQAYRHAVISLTDITDFKQRVRRPDVEFIALHKPPGHGLWVYPRLVRLLRELRPAVVHTRNMAALEVAVPARLAGVPVRVHGEHGRDVGDLDGSSKRHQRIRRLYRPFVNHYVALSRDLQTYLQHRIGVPAARISQIYNGVDSQRFYAASSWPPRIPGCPFGEPGHWLVGTVGRMAEVKDQTTLASAFVQALQIEPALRSNLRLVMIGDGPLREKSAALLRSAGVAELAWLPGERADVADVMRGLNCFVLPSLGEGISNTILEAMSTGLPVIATDVGGNAELVAQDRSGVLVPAANSQAIALKLVQLASDPQSAAAMGREGRAEVERRFSLEAMVAAYQGLYDRLLVQAGSNPRMS